MCTPLSSMFKQLPKPVSVDGITPCKRQYLSSVMDICTKEMGSKRKKSLKLTEKPERIKEAIYPKLWFFHTQPWDV